MTPDSQEISSAVGTDLLFENEIVRVWEMRLDPDASSPLHQHWCDYLIAYQNGLSAELSRDGVITHATFPPNYIAYFPIGKDGSDIQLLKNVGNEQHVHYVIELVQNNNVAANTDNSSKQR